MPFDLSDMPARVAALPKDRRGLPIPAIVLVDGAGEPHFTMNDMAVVARFYREGRCSICGERLGALKCFVGGPASAFHPHGMYFDGPMHRDCAVFALHACPYLAMADRYARRVAVEKLAARIAVPEGRVLVHEDPTMHAPQPAVFVLGSCRRFRMEGKHYVPERPWAEVRFFRAGQEISNAEARALTEADPTPAAPFSELVWP
jgi:hypothetical protein